MPDLSALRAFLDDPGTDPDDRNPRMVLADALDSEGRTDPRGSVLRAACDIHQRIGDVVLPDRLDSFWTESPGWEFVGRELEALAAKPPVDAEGFRRQYSDLIRGNVPLDPEHLEQTLRLQYDLQVRLLTSLNLLEGEPGQHFITALDGKRYPLPAFEEVFALLQQSDLNCKIPQGFDTLLLVPFGLPLDRLLDAWRDGLRRNTATLRSVGQFNRNDPLWVWDGYQSDLLVYNPHALTASHHGRTKQELLTTVHRGWEVMLVEGSLADLPRAGQGQNLGSRPQIECGRSPEQYLRNLPDDEVGLTAEAYIIAFLDALERRGQVLDTRTAACLMGAYLPTSQRVSFAYWLPAFGRANLDGGVPGFRGGFGGARVAVRVGLNP